MAAEVKAQITGTVWKVECQVGTSVQSGDVLVIFESMKMEIPLEAPTSGKIHKICVKEGDVVEEGKVVVVLE